MTDLPSGASKALVRTGTVVSVPVILEIELPLNATSLFGEKAVSLSTLSTETPSPVIEDVATKFVSNALPEPLPAPVATNTVPTLLLVAPIPVNEVSPAVLIMYSRPTTKLPAEVWTAP